MLVTIQHKVPDEDTSAIEHDPRLLFDRRQCFPAFYTPSYEWGSCETGIHGTCCKSALKLRFPAFLGDPQSLGQAACLGSYTCHILSAVYTCNLDLTQILIYLGGSRYVANS